MAADRSRLLLSVVLAGVIVNANGATTTPASIQCGSANIQNTTDCTLDVAFIVDGSGSIRDTNPPGVDNWELVLSFVVSMIDHLRIGPNETRVGAVTFGNEGILEFQLTNFTDKANLTAAVRNMPYDGGNTNTTGGLRVARTLIFSTIRGDRPAVPDVAVLVTDGVPTREVEGLANEVQMYKNAGIRIVGVGVTNAVNETILRSIVTYPDQDYFYVSNFDQYSTIVDRVVYQICRPVPDNCYPTVAVPIFTGPHNVNGQGQSCTDYYFMCRVSYTRPVTDDGARFDVALTFDGQLAPSFQTTTSAQLDVLFEPADLKEHFGTNVSCAVRSYWADSPTAKSNFVSSTSSFFVGIRHWTDNVVSNRIEMNESASFLPIHFQVTVPVSCSQCSVTLRLSRHTGLTVSSCSVTFYSSDPPQRVRSINIRAVQTPGTNSRVVFLEWYNVSSPCNDSAWDGYRQLDIPVLIVDEVTAGSCTTDGDPHIRTFDSTFFSVYFEGDFILWKSTASIQAEVHVRFQQCEELNVTASCNCAVAFREGDSIVGVYACDPTEPPIVIQYLRDSRTAQPLVQIGSDGLYFYITMPSGRALSVSTACPYCGRLTITVYSISDDVGHAEGLCGNFNGLPDDDRMPKGSSESENQEEPIVFSTSYMLQPNASFINGHIFFPECSSGSIALPTECRCGQTDGGNCVGISAATGALVNVVKFSTRGTDRCLLTKRSAMLALVYADTNDDDVISSTQLLPKVVGSPPRAPLYPNVTAVGAINENQATEHCNIPLTTSAGYSGCVTFTSDIRDKIIKSCILDVQLTGMPDAVVNGIMSKYGEACRRGIQEDDARNVSEAKTEYASAVESLALKVTPKKSINPIRTLANAEVQAAATAMYCQSDCSGNGVCKAEMCVCDAGYTGAMCSVPYDIIPVVTQWKLGERSCTGDSCNPILCDVSNGRSCATVNVTVNSKTFSVSTSSVLCKSLAADASVYFPQMTLVTNNRFKFNLPLSPNDPEPTSPNYTWAVSLTNNNETFSDELRFTVYDSVCMDCSTSTCSRKNWTCLIGGKCYAFNDRRTNFPCEGCKPESSESSWTRAWVGDACLQSVREPPLITRLKFGPTFCDLRAKGANCTSVAVEANRDTYTEPVVVKCIGSSGVHYPRTYRTATSGLAIMFDLPLDIESPSPSYSWNVSLSNDNVTFTNETLAFFVFDSVCLECSNESKTCRHKDGTCLINGRCYDSEERVWPNRCFGCFPAMSNSTSTRGWVGSTCSQPTSEPPVITGVKFGPLFCDDRDPGADCRSVALQIAADTYADTVVIRMVSAGVTNYGSFTQSYQSYSAVEIRFNLSISALDDTSTSPYYRWNVSVSNDNRTFSDPVHFLTFDSVCIECSNSTGLCRQKVQTCLIDGKCHTGGSFNATDSCLICSPENSNSSWTIYPSCHPTITTAAAAATTTNVATSQPATVTTSSSKPPYTSNEIPVQANSSADATGSASVPSSHAPQTTSPSTTTLAVSTGLQPTTAFGSTSSTADVPRSTASSISLSTSSPETSPSVAITPVTTINRVTTPVAATSLTINIFSTASSSSSSTPDHTTTTRTSTAARMTTTDSVTTAVVSTARDTSTSSSTSSTSSSSTNPTTAAIVTTLSTAAAFASSSRTVVLSTASPTASQIQSTSSSTLGRVTDSGTNQPVTTRDPVTTGPASTERITTTIGTANATPSGSTNPTTTAVQTTVSTAAFTSTSRVVELSTTSSTTYTNPTTGPSSTGNPSALTSSAAPMTSVVTTPVPASSERSSGTTVAPSWSKWTAWSSCTTGCDGSRTSSRTRTCMNGDICIGDRNQTINCLMADCPVKMDEEGEGCILKTALTNFTKFDEIYVVDKFFEVLVDSVNNYCTANKYSACKQLLAPTDIVEPAGGWLTVTTLSGVSIASGYPNTTGADSTIIKLLFKSTVSRLRSQCSIGSSRRKRQADDTVVYLDKDLLAAALNASVSNISTAADLTIYSIAPSADATSVTTVTATATSVTSDATSTESATTGNRPGDTTMVVVVACVVSVAVVLLLLTAYGAFAVATRNQRPTTVRDARPRRFAGQFPYAPRSDFHTRPPYYFNK